MPHRTLSLEEVAEYLHISTRDVQQLVRGQEIPHEKVGGRTVFRQREIAAWASRRILGFKQKELVRYHRSSSEAAQTEPGRGLILDTLMQPSYIELDLSARTRAAAIRAMIKLAESTHLLYQPDDLLQSILAREALCSTALRGGFALLHPRHHDPYMFEESFVAFGRNPTPIPFGAPDGETTDLFLLICCEGDRLHLHALARLSRIFSEEPLRNDVRDAATREEIYARLLEAERQVAG